MSLPKVSRRTSVQVAGEFGSTDEAIRVAITRNWLGLQVKNRLIFNFLLNLTELPEAKGNAPLILCATGVGVVVYRLLEVETECLGLRLPVVSLEVATTMTVQMLRARGSKISPGPNLSRPIAEDDPEITSAIHQWTVALFQADRANWGNIAVAAGVNVRALLRQQWEANELSVAIGSKM